MLIDGQPYERKDIKSLTLETPRTGEASSSRVPTVNEQSKAKSGHPGISGRPGKFASPRFFGTCIQLDTRCTRKIETS